MSATGATLQPPMTRGQARVARLPYGWPLYAAFGTTPDLTPFMAVPAQADLNAKNTALAYGAAASAHMDFADADRAPMHQLNEIVWKSVRGANSPMPAPVHRYRPLADAAAEVR